MQLNNVRIKAVTALQQGVTASGNEWTKVDVIVEDDSREYGESVKVTFMNDRVRLVDGMKEGDRVNVSFSMSARTFTTKTGETIYQNDARGWAVSKIG